MRDVVIEHVAAENARDRQRVINTYSREGAVFEDVATGALYEGAEKIADENYSHLWEGFPGLVRRIDRWTFGDDSVVVELTLSGRHEGKFRGVPPTGRDASLRIIAQFQFDHEGRIKQETAYYDSLTFMRHLGLTGPRGNAPAS